MTEPRGADRQRLADLFERALALPREQRAAFIDETCASEAELREELISLLESHTAAPRFLDHLGERVLPAALGALSRVASDEIPPSDHVVGHYEVLERLGGGGMGVVYKARDLALDRLVALKFLPAHLSADAEAQARLKSEARATSALDHPNIAVVYEIGATEPLKDDPEGGRLFIAMAYYEGDTLKQRIARGRLPVSQALDYASQLADGLARAHEAGIVHRDIKPANVMVTARDQIKIVDFGLAKDTGAELTREGLRLGTVAYMSPEQTRGEAVDPRTDVWSLGVVLYEMLTGRRPFLGESDDAVIYAIRHDAPAPITRPDVSAALAGIVAACLAKEPSQRPARADAVLAKLRVLANQTGHEEPFGQAPARRITAGMPARARRWAGGLAAGLMALAVGWLATRSMNAPAPAPPALEPNRVVVAPFANETGLSELDAVGRMVADWITEGASRLGTFEVVPAMTVLAAAAEVRPLAPLDLARSSGAGLLVTGRYYRSQGSLHFQAQLVAAESGRIVRPIEAASVAADSIMAGVSRIRERVLNALMPESDTASHLHLASEPPGYEAYRDYLQGMEAFLRGDAENAAARWERAVGLNPEHPIPRLALSVALWSLGHAARADTVLAPVIALRSTLGPFEAGTLDMALGLLRGDLPLVYAGNLRAAQVAPGSIAEYSVAANAWWLNRPREAVRILERLGPDRPEALSYWWSLIEAQLMLGDGAAALMSAREASERYRDSPHAAHYELIPLAALGRVAEIEALVQRRLALPAEGPPSPAYSFREAAAWLDATDSAAAVRLRNQALAWYEETARDGPPTLGLRVGRAETLVELGDHAAALAVLEDVAGAETEDGRKVAAPRDLVEIQVVGLLGRIAALDGETAEAERLARLLVAVPPRQGLTGVVDPTWRWRPWQQAGIFAALGDTERAVAALRRAHRVGLRFSARWRVTPMLVPLHDDPTFEALLRPAG